MTTFDAFAELQDITGATDDELAQMLFANCGPPLGATYQDDLTTILLRWLGAITGVPWIRAYEHGNRPGVETTAVKRGQYGTVHMLWPRPMSKTPHRVEYTRPGSDDVCEELAVWTEYTFQLDVYRDSGAGTRQQTDPDIIQTPVGSAIDVLTRVSVRCQHDRMKRALKQYCVKLGSEPISDIKNVEPELVKETYETRAAGTLVVYAPVVSSMRLPVAIEYGLDLAECEIEEVDQPVPFDGCV